MSELPVHRTHTLVTVTLGSMVVLLLLTAMMRYLQVHADQPPPVARYASLGYVLITVGTAIALVRLHVPLQRLGFGVSISLMRAVGLGLLGVLLIQGFAWVLELVWEPLFGSSRDLRRFNNVSGSLQAMLQLMLLSWTFAAVGEELMFRILLMRSFSWVLGGGFLAVSFALVFQAVVFGLIHAYQGPAGIVGAMINGLVFGALVIAGRGSVWPAVIAHGGSNSVGIVQLYLAT